MSDTDENAEEPIRKPKSERRKTKCVFSFRATPELAKRLKKAAANTDRKMSSWLRALALEALGQPEMSRPVLTKLYVELGKIGVNLNQITKHANTNGQIELEAELRATMAEMVTLRKQIADALK